MSTKTMQWNSYERASRLQTLLVAATAGPDDPVANHYNAVSVGQDPRQLAGDVIDSLACWLEVPNGSKPNLDHLRDYLTGGMITALREPMRRGELAPEDLRRLATGLRAGHISDDDALNVLRPVVEAAAAERRRFQMMRR